MGVVALLASVIENAGNSNELIQNSLENNNEWQSYVKGDLFEMRKKESKPLGGADRPHSAHSSAAGASSDGGDEDDDKSSEIVLFLSLFFSFYSFFSFYKFSLIFYCYYFLFYLFNYLFNNFYYIIF